MLDTPLDTSVASRAISNTGLHHSTSMENDEARDTAKKFEALLLQTMLKNMRAATPGDDLLNGEQAGLYLEMMDQHIATEISESNSLGLADSIYRQLVGQSATPSSNAKGSTMPIQMASVTSDNALVNTNYQPQKYNSPMGFVNRIHTTAQQTADELGTSTAAVVAIAALETGWGKNVAMNQDGSSTHNLFGIKADSQWQGPSSVVRTHEFTNGESRPEKAAFRVYQSEQQSIRDFGDFLQENPRYGKALESAADPEQFIRELQRAGYATDPDYADKAISVMNSITGMESN